MSAGAEPVVLVSAAEPSGDRAAARVVLQLRRNTDIRCFGIGGRHLAEVGVALLRNIERDASLGLADSARGLLRWSGIWAELRDRIRTERPVAALLTDAPDFHLPLARVLRAAGVPVVYYIGPQVWAWRPGRLQLMRKRADVTALILPFEKPLYDRAFAPAVFVGHPILDEPSPMQRESVRAALDLSSEDRLVALLPGSRQGEIARHLPAMADAARQFRAQNIAAIAAPGSGIDVEVQHRFADLRFLPRNLAARDLLSAADAALVASGTATLEATVARVPFAAVYRTDAVSFAVARHLLKLPYVALPNWIAGEKIVPELLQNDVTGPRLFETARLLLDEQVASNQRFALRRIARSLGEPGAARKTADLVLERLR